MIFRDTQTWLQEEREREEEVGGKREREKGEVTVRSVTDTREGRERRAPSTVSSEAATQTSSQVVSNSVEVFGGRAGEVEKFVEMGGHGGRVLGVVWVESVHQPLVARLSAAVAAAG